MRVFPRRFTPGTPLCARGLAEGLAKMAMFWEQLEICNGVLDWPAGRPRITCMPGVAVTPVLPRKPFDLVSYTDAENISMLRNYANDAALYIGGRLITDITYSGDFSYQATGVGPRWDYVTTLAADTYFWMVITYNAGAGVYASGYLDAGSAMPDPASTSQDIFPLWYIAASGDPLAISANTITDLRGSYRALPTRTNATAYQVLQLDSSKMPSWDWPRWHA